MPFAGTAQKLFQQRSARPQPSRPVGFLSELHALAKSFRSLKHTLTLRTHGTQSKLTRRHLEVDNYAAIASGENADRKREIAFTCDPFMFFSETLNAVAGVARLSATVVVGNAGLIHDKKQQALVQV
jgi:hypothetical protein